MLSAIVVSCTSADQGAAPLPAVAPREAAEQPVGGGVFHDRYAFLPTWN